MGSASFTAAGGFTWTAPDGVTAVSITTKGGGGGSLDGNTEGGGGGGGGCSVVTGHGVTAGNDYNGTVGSGGASNLFGGNDGSSSNFDGVADASGGLAHANGGGGGAGLTSQGGAAVSHDGGQAGTPGGNGADGGASGQPGDGGHGDTGAGDTTNGVDGLVQLDWDDPVLAPGTPTGLAATANLVHHIPVSWDAADTATGYRLYRDSDGYTTPIFDGAGTSYDDTGLGDSVTHMYKVSAYNTGGESAKSASVSATTHAGVTVPGVSSRRIPHGNYHPWLS